MSEETSEAFGPPEGSGGEGAGAGLGQSTEHPQDGDGPGAGAGGSPPTEHLGDAAGPASMPEAAPPPFSPHGSPPAVSQAVAQASLGMAACAQAHRLLLQRVGGLDEVTARRPSLLPGWSVAHVLTHLARNADGISRWIEGTLSGAAVLRYPGGREQRDHDIALGSTRPAPAVLEDLWQSSVRLEQLWTRASAAGWPDVDPRPSDAPWAPVESPWRRLVEVEIHHADLGLGYHAGEWSDALVDWLLPRRLERLATEVSDPGRRRRLLTWLAGRTDEPGIGRLEL